MDEPWVQPTERYQEVKLRASDVVSSCKVFFAAFTCLVALAVICYWLGSVMFPPRVFRVSREVTIQEIGMMSRPGTALYKVQEKLLDLYKDIRYNRLCGLAAPYVEEYIRFAVIPVHGDYKVAFNLWYEKDKEVDAVVTTREKSPLCGKHDKKGVETVRYASIDAHYTDMEGIDVTIPLTTEEAFCFQHIVDILKGVWPCHQHIESKLGKSEL